MIEGCKNDTSNGVTRAVHTWLRLGFKADGGARGTGTGMKAHAGMGSIGIHSSRIAEVWVRVGRGRAAPKRK